MRPIFLSSMRLPSGTIEDRLSVYDCSDARGGNLKANGLARTRFSAQRRKDSLAWQVRGGSGFWCSPSGRQTEPWNPPRFKTGPLVLLIHCANRTHDDDPKHSIPCGLLAILRCYGRSHHHAYIRRLLPQELAWLHDGEGIERC